MCRARSRSRPRTTSNSARMAATMRPIRRQSVLTSDPVSAWGFLADQPKSIVLGDQLHGNDLAHFKVASGGTLSFIGWRCHPQLWRFLRARRPSRTRRVRQGRRILRGPRQDHRQWSDQPLWLRQQRHRPRRRDRRLGLHPRREARHGQRQPHFLGHLRRGPRRGFRCARERPDGFQVQQRPAHQHERRGTRRRCLHPRRAVANESRRHHRQPRHGHEHRHRPGRTRFHSLRPIPHRRWREAGLLHQRRGPGQCRRCAKQRPHHSRAPHLDLDRRHRHLCQYQPRRWRAARAAISSSTPAR